MNVVQRYNLQMGVKEDRRFEHTTYISDGSMLDNYLLEKERQKEFIKEVIRGEEYKMQEKEIEEQVEKALAKVLDKLLK